MQITSEIDKYLQEAAEKHERDDNFFDGQHMATNTSSPQQEANFLEQDEYVDIDEEDDAVSPMIKTPVHIVQVLQDTTSNIRMS